MTHANGLNIHPRICCRLRSIKPNIAFTIAIIATNATSMAATFAANFIPLVAPLESASIILSSFLSSAIFISPKVSDVSVSGYIILAITNAAGALMMEAANKWPAIPGISPNILTYIAMTPPATVANPLTIIAINSDFVILDIKGLTSSGASV